jgi:hypothetical protein
MTGVPSVMAEMKSCLMTVASEVGGFDHVCV